MSDILDVYLNNTLAGKLKQHHGKITFTYTLDYIIKSYHIPLSISMPFRERSYEENIAESFFAGLLPEGEVLNKLARDLQISPKNTFRLLEKIGGDCAGAIALFPETKQPPRHEVNFVWMTKDDLASKLEAIKLHPFLASQSNIRLSLAGAQDKLPLCIVDDNRFAMGSGLATTHILKSPINMNGITESVFNEYFCMQLALLCDILVAPTQIIWIKEIPYLAIWRYDRTIMKGTMASYAMGFPYFITRLHQEDFCQALTIHPNQKYQSEGGPSFKECINLLEKYTKNPVLNVWLFIRVVIFNYIIGNSDAHGKNFSLLYEDSGCYLAPAYDLLCTTAYSSLNQKMAMKIGSTYDWRFVRLEHWHSLMPQNKSAERIISGYLKEFATKIPEKADFLKNRLNKEGIDAKIFSTIKEIINKRSQKILNYF